MPEMMHTADGPVTVAKWLTDGCKVALANGFAIVAQETERGLTYTPCTPFGVRMLRRQGGVSHVFWPKRGALGPGIEPAQRTAFVADKKAKRRRA